MAETEKYVDPGWTADMRPGQPPMTEFTAPVPGALSPFGGTVFPMPYTELPYVHPVTETED